MMIPQTWPLSNQEVKGGTGDQDILDWEVSNG